MFPLLESFPVTRLPCYREVPKAVGKNGKVHSVSLIGVLFNDHAGSTLAAGATSFFYLLLVKYTRHFWHPLLAPLAPEFPFRRQVARVIQRPRHDISKVLHRRCTDFQNPASACRAELAVQSCATPVICFVNGRLFGLGSIAEGRNWNLCCQSKRCSEEFLARGKH